MPRVIRSPGKGTLVQPVSVGVGSTEAAIAQPAAQQQQQQQPPHQSVPVPATPDFLLCFQLHPPCALTYSAASDWLMRQPASVTSLAPPTPGEWVRSQRATAASRHTRGEDTADDARGRMIDDGDVDDGASDVSLDPAALAAFDVACGASPAGGISEGGRSAAGGALSSVSVSLHTTATAAKVHAAGKEGSSTSAASEDAQHAVPADTATSLSKGSPPAWLNPGAVPVGHSPAGARKPAKVRDEFAFGSQSSSAASSLSRSDSLPPVADVLPPHSAVVAAAVARPPGDATTPSLSLHIPAPTPPSTAASVAPAPPVTSSSSPHIPPTPTDRSAPSTHSLPAVLSYALDPHVVLPSLAQLHPPPPHVAAAHPRTPQPTGALELQLAKLHADEHDMRRMDGEFARLAAPLPSRAPHPPARGDVSLLHNNEQAASRSPLGYQATPSWRDPPPVSPFPSTIHTNSRHVDATILKSQHGEPPNPTSLQPQAAHGDRQTEHAAVGHEPTPPVASTRPPSPSHDHLNEMEDASQALATPASAQQARRDLDQTMLSDSPLHLTSTSTQVPVPTRAPVPVVAVHALMAAAPLTAASSSSFSSASLPRSPASSKMAVGAVAPPISPAAADADAAVAAVAATHAPHMPLFPASPPPSTRPTLHPPSPAASAFPTSPMSDVCGFEPARPDTDTSVMASMSLELTFDEDEDDDLLMLSGEQKEATLEQTATGSAREEARAVPHEQQESDKMPGAGPTTGHAVAPPPASGTAVTSPVAVGGVTSPSSPPSALPGQGTIPHSVIDLVMDGDCDAVPAAPLGTPQRLSVQPRLPSVVTPPALKFSTSPAAARSPASRVVDGGGSNHVLSAPLTDRCSATQILHSGSALISPIKTIPSPAGLRTSTQQSPLKRMQMQMPPQIKVAKQLQFGEADKALSHSDRIARASSATRGGGAAAAAGLPTSRTTSAAATPDLAAASALVGHMDALSQCSHSRSLDSASHHPSFDLTPAAPAAMVVGEVSQSQQAAAPASPALPADRGVDGEVGEQKVRDVSAPAAAVTVPVPFSGVPTPSPVPVVPMGWSRARKVRGGGGGGDEADVDNEVDVIHLDEEKRHSSAAPTSAEKRRGKNFSKQSKLTRHNEAVATTDLSDSKPISARPVHGVCDDKPTPVVVSISLLSESQGQVLEESQAEQSIDPIRRARAARAKKEAEKEAERKTAERKAAEEERSTHAMATHATTDTHSGQETKEQRESSNSPSPAAPTAAAVAAPVRPMASVSSPVTSSPVVAVIPSAPRVPSPETRPSSARVSVSGVRSGASSPASRSVSPAAAAAASARARVTSPVPVPAPPPSFYPRVPHHYGSGGRKIIVERRVPRTPTSAATKADMLQRKLSPSPTARAAQQDRLIPPAVTTTIAKAKEGQSAPITPPNDDVECLPARPVACLSAILEETSSNASLATSSSVHPPTGGQHTRAASSTATRMAKRSAAPPPEEHVSGEEATPMDVDPTPASESQTEPMMPAPMLVLVRPAPSAPPPPPPALAVDAAAPTPPVPLPAATSSRKRGRATNLSPPVASAAGSAPLSGSEEAESAADESGTGSANKRAKRGAATTAAAAAPPITRRASSRPASQHSSAASAVPENSRAVSSLDSVESASDAAAASLVAPPAKRLRSSVLKGVLFLLTGVFKHSSSEASKHAAHLTNLIQQAGGQCIESLSDLPAPHAASPQILVLASAPKRTMKFMLSLARGLPPLQPAWLEACVAAGRMLVPSDAQLVPLKDEGGDVSKYPSAWLRSLRERQHTRALPLPKRILYGLRIGVVGGTSFVSEVSVVCREAGALVWSCVSDEEQWRRWHEEAEATDETHAAAAAASSSSTRTSTRRSGPKDVGTGAGSSLPVASAAARVDFVIAEKAESVTAWVKRSLTDTAAGARATKGRVPMPPVLSVKWMLQCLMQQKRMSDAEREEYLLM